MGAFSKVQFKTADGLRLAGRLYSGGRARPSIIMTHGFSGLKEHFLPDFAERFQAEGYTVLLYDNRCWGESEGSPRKEVDAVLQTRDYFDAFIYVRTLPDADPNQIVYWGTSLSGGNVIAAASVNRQVKAVIAQVPFVGDRAGPGLPDSTVAQLLDDRNVVREGGDSFQAPVFPNSLEEAQNGATKAILPSPESIIYLDELGRRGLTSEKTTTLQSLLNSSFFVPGAVIHRISPTPFLMVVASHDETTMTNLQLAAFQEAKEPKKLVTLDGGHFEPYFGPTFERNIAAQLDFLRGIFALLSVSLHAHL